MDRIGQFVVVVALAASIGTLCGMVAASARQGEIINQWKRNYEQCDATRAGWERLYRKVQRDHGGIDL